jgi:uncharacterized protein YndB with AHSA1/START domain
VVNTIERSIHIDAPRSAIYEFITEPTNLPEVWTGLVEVSNSNRKPDGTHRFDTVYKLAGMHFHGRAETREAVTDTLSEVAMRSGLECVWRWTFEGRDDGTDVHLRVSFEVPPPLVDKVGAPYVLTLEERETELLLVSLKDRIESMRAEKSLRA